MPLKVPRRLFWAGVACGFFFGVVVFVAFLGFAHLRFRHHLSNDIELPPPPIPATGLAYLDWAVRSLSGERIEMNSHRGEVIFVNFWATWCEPCHLEMPRIQKLHAMFKDRMVFACISDEPPEKLRSFVREKGFDVPVFVLEGARPATFDGEGVPATFIIDRGGKIVLRHVGPVDWGHESAIEFINRLISEGADARDVAYEKAADGGDS